MTFEIKKATKTQARLRMAIHGPSGCGKTYSALRIASSMGKRICLVDTEHGSASKYADKFDFDVIEVEGDYNPAKLMEMLKAIGAGGYDFAVVDSMTHFWNGTGGFLSLVDQEVIKMKSKGNKPDSFSAWKTVDPIYQRMRDSILTSPMHVIVTLRAKQEYAKVEGENGRTKIQKLGLAPEMRDNFQYEMDVEGMLDLEHNLAIGKTRCEALDGQVFNKPGEDIASILQAWLGHGAPMPPPKVSDFERLSLGFEAASTSAHIEGLKSQVNAAFREKKVTREETDKLVELSRAAVARITEAEAAAQ